MKYTCKRCGYETSNLTNLKKHLSRKDPCQPLLSNETCEHILEKLHGKQYQLKTYTCDVCFKVYKDSSGLCYHKKTKSCKPKNDNNNESIHIEVINNSCNNCSSGNINIELSHTIDSLPVSGFISEPFLLNHIKSKDDSKITLEYICAEIKLLRDENKELRNENKKLKLLFDDIKSSIISQSSHANIIIHQNSPIINQNAPTTVFNTININNFGNERIIHITKDFLDDCLKRSNNGMKNLFKEIHFNIQIPENHNIRVLSKKQNMLEKYIDGVWHPCDKNNTLDEMIKKGYRILFKHLNESSPFETSDNDQNEQFIRNEYVNKYLMQIMRKDSNIYYELRRDLYMMILDGTLYILGKV